MDTKGTWVISVISNPARFKSRYRLFRRFEKKLAQHKVNHLIVEMAFGNRPFEITERHNPNHLQLRSFEELWAKERMITLGVHHLSRIDPNWEYLAWVDGDLQFERDDWVEEMVHELQHFMFIQLFQTAIDLGPHGEVLQVHNGFMWNYVRGHCDVDSKGNGYGYVGHPGYAWACRREAYELMGGLIDRAILGSGDHSMALALIGRGHASYPKGVTAGYKEMIHLWQKNADLHIKRDVGFMKGSILHEFHGAKKNRKYVERWDILIEHKFCPFADLKADSHGLWQLANPNNIGLRDGIRAYNRQRDEDGTEPR